MDFEQLGRRIDREMKKLLHFLEKEVKPTTQKKAAEVLRKASKSLDRAADEIEAALSRKRS
jgi:hypothetical protein